MTTECQVSLSSSLNVDCELFISQQLTTVTWLVSLLDGGGRLVFPCHVCGIRYS